MVVFLIRESSLPRPALAFPAVVFSVSLECKGKWPAASWVGSLATSACLLPTGPEVNHRWDGRVAEVPRNARVAAGIRGRLPLSGFVVTQGSLRGTDRVPRQLQAAPAPVLRVLVTTVTCLSNCARKRAAARAPLLFLLVFSLPPFHMSQWTQDSLLPPGTWARG